MHGNQRSCCSKGISYWPAWTKRTDPDPCPRTWCGRCSCPRFPRAMTRSFQVVARVELVTFEPALHLSARLAEVTGDGADIAMVLAEQRHQLVSLITVRAGQLGRRGGGL